MTKREIKLYKKWLDDKIGPREVGRELGISPNTAYSVFAHCAKFLHNNK